MQSRYHVIRESDKEKFEQICGKYLTGGWTWLGDMQYVDNTYMQVFITWNPEYPDFNLEGINNAQS